MRHGSSTGHLLHDVDKVERVMPTMPQPASSVVDGRGIPSLIPQMPSAPVFTAAAMNEALDDYSKTFKAVNIGGAKTYTKGLENLEMEYLPRGGAVQYTKAQKKLIDDTSKAKKYIGALNKGEYWLKRAVHAVSGFEEYTAFMPYLYNLQKRYPHSIPAASYVVAATNYFYKIGHGENSGSGGDDGVGGDIADLVQTMLEVATEALDDGDEEDD
jgi:hypothetical protein